MHISKQRLLGQLIQDWRCKNNGEVIGAQAAMIENLMPGGKIMIALGCYTGFIYRRKNNILDDNQKLF